MLLNSVTSGEQEVQRKLQGHHRCRLSHQGGSCRGSTGDNAGSFSDSAIVQRTACTHGASVVGHSRARTISVIRCCVLPRSGLLCSGLRRKQLKKLRYFGQLEG